MKEYRLKDLEIPGKLISSCDVNFIENSSPNYLAIINNILPPLESINKLVNDMISTKSTTPSFSAPDPTKIHLPESCSSTPPSKPIKELLLLPSIPKKVSKWQNLPKREPSSRNCQLPAKFHNKDQSAYLSNAVFAFVAMTSEPRTLKKVLLLSCSKQWEKAINSKFNQLVKAKVFQWVECLPNNKKAIGSCIVFKGKLDSHGNHLKFKAQIVAQSFLQIPGLDFTKTFLSVAKFTILQIFLVLTVFLDLELHQVDIVGACLQGDLNKEIYIKVSNGLVEKYRNSQKFWRLKKALYGLKQAGRQWKKHVRVTGEKTPGDSSVNYNL